MKSRLIYFLYRFLLAAASPFIILYLLIRAARNGGYLRSLPERLGQLPPSFQQTGAGAIWLHAVSVGEVLLMAELLRRLRAEFSAAGLYVSTSTLAGRAIADQKLAGLADGVFYAPLDYAWIVRRVLRRLRPCAVVVAETEIWPNLFREAKRAGCGLVIVNGRISDRVAGRYEKLRWFFAHVLCWPDALLVQSEAMAGRYLAAGAPLAKVRVAGNLKYDVEPGKPPGEVLEFLDRLGPARVWIAASTMPPDEDETVIRAFRELAAAFPALLLILAPRKPERFDLVESRLREAGVRYLRRSALGAKPELKLPGVLLLDTIGELSGLFARAEVVFMGGSLVTWGGHNILEPAVFGKPVIVGPYMQNFREMAEAFQQAGALVQVDSGQDLGRAVQELLNDAGRAARIGELGRQCAQAQRGATAAAVVEIGRACRQSAPCVPGPIALWPLARLWEVGSAVKSALAPTGRLTARVISVGNLSMGGTGKTPMVAYLAERLPKTGILTRGYGRRSSELVMLRPGESAPVEATGDEAQIFLRSGRAALGVGADRLETGRRLEQKAGVQLLILDDGFQHWRLERDIDLVVIDALDPFGGGDTFPRGRLREPLRALARADVFVITRAIEARPAIEARLRQLQPRAAIFYARTVPLGWVEGATGRRFLPRDLPCERYAAFCGLANPASFWNTLASLGLKPGEKTAFPDHTRYRADQIAPLLARHSALLTTEKDWINLGAFRRPGIYWLEISLEIDREAEFLKRVLG